MSGVPIDRSEVRPYYIVDELAFAVDDYREACGADWDPEMPPDFRKIDATGYAVSARAILGDHPHTYHATVDNEHFVWSWTQEQWLMVGEDL